MYAESLIELGIAGFFIVLGYLACIWRSARTVFKLVAGSAEQLDDQAVALYSWVAKALVVWIVMCLLFSLASYGLSEYQWYLIGGLATVTLRLAAQVRPVVGNRKPSFRRGATSATHGKEYPFEKSRSPNTP
jgi:hypothetical protein